MGWPSSKRTFQISNILDLFVWFSLCFFTHGPMVKLPLNQHERVASIKGNVVDQKRCCNMNFPTRTVVLHRRKLDFRLRIAPRKAFDLSPYWF